VSSESRAAEGSASHHEDSALAAQEASRLARQAQRQSVDLMGVLDDALSAAQALAEQSGVAIHVNRPRALPPAHGDPALFHQVVLSLLTASIGQASNDLSLVITRQRQHTLWQFGPLDVVSADSLAEGMASELDVCRALLDAYGGSVEVVDGEDGFYLTASILSAQPTSSVLIIDDSAATIDLYSRYLDGRGIAVRAARNREEVDSELAKGPPDAILLDVLMPGENGWELLQRLKTLPETREIPVTICSVLSQPSLALSLGAVRVLQKPIAERDLVGAVQGALTGK